MRAHSTLSRDIRTRYKYFSLSISILYIKLIQVQHHVCLYFPKNMSHKDCKPALLLILEIIPGVARALLIIISTSQSYTEAHPTAPKISQNQRLFNHNWAYTN